MGVSDRDCVPSVFDVSAGFDVPAAMSFLRVGLPSSPYQGVMAGAEVARACAGCEVGLSLCTAAVTTLSLVCL